MRSIILHYHLFKNAGTSVDAILKRNFPGQWLTAGFDGMENRTAVADWICSHPQAVAFSLHPAQFPLPEIADVRIVPIVFLRHPLDRIRSAYAFEKDQPSDSYGAKLAKQTDLSGYVRTRLDRSQDRQCRNFQTFRLARAVPGPEIADLNRAVTALQRLPFVGIVESFEQSMARLESLLQPSFPGFKSFAARKNVTTAPDLSLDDRLSNLRAEIGGELFEELLDANLKDICLHHAASTRLAEVVRSGRAHPELQVVESVIPAGASPSAGSRIIAPYLGGSL